MQEFITRKIINLCFENLIMTKVFGNTELRKINGKNLGIQQLELKRIRWGIPKMFL